MNMPVTEVMAQPWPVVSEYEDLLSALEQVNRGRAEAGEPQITL